MEVIVLLNQSNYFTVDFHNLCDWCERWRLFTSFKASEMCNRHSEIIERTHTLLTEHPVSTLTSSNKQSLIEKHSIHFRKAWIPRLTKRERNPIKLSPTCFVNSFFDITALIFMWTTFNFVLRPFHTKKTFSSRNLFPFHKKTEKFYFAPFIFHHLSLHSFISRLYLPMECIQHACGILPLTSMK